MNRSRAFLVLNAALVSFAFACSSPGDEGVSSDDALTGSLANAKACAVRDAYAAAELTAFKSAAKTELPGVQESATASLSKFDVNGVGTVFVVEDGATMSFYDANGALLAKAGTASAELAWSQANNAPLSCGAPSTPTNGGSSGGTTTPTDPGATSCLATAPIDATQFPYTPSAPAAAGKCTTQELANISSYYSQHGGDQDFTVDAWKTSVSPSCGSCAFGEENGATWAPILNSPVNGLDVIQGGCIATVSNSQDCGRTYQQYQTCTLEACLANCTTQEEYSKCRQDQAVTTTACKGAVDALLAACGQDNIGTYETACRGTTYTFEGPIRVQCVTGH